MRKTLWDMAVDQSARLAGFAEGLDERWMLRLQELGFRPGEEVVCVHAPRFGAPRVYRVSNTVISIEDTVARHVWTEAGSA